MENNEITIQLANSNVITQEAGQVQRLILPNGTRIVFISVRLNTTQERINLGAFRIVENGKVLKLFNPYQIVGYFDKAREMRICYATNADGWIDAAGTWQTNEPFVCTAVSLAYMTNISV